MKRSAEFTEESKLVAVRLPDMLAQKAEAHCKREDLNFSQLMRRALRRELASEIQETEVVK